MSSTQRNTFRWHSQHRSQQVLQIFWDNVAIGNYFKHLMMYDDGRFAKHSRFSFFALNTEMRWRALQAGRIYIHQHPGDEHFLTVGDLRDMVG